MENAQTAAWPFEIPTRTSADPTLLVLELGRFAAGTRPQQSLCDGMLFRSG